jgi:hypothetical protein
LFRLSRPLGADETVRRVDTNEENCFSAVFSVFSRRALILKLGPSPEPELALSLSRVNDFYDGNKTSLNAFLMGDDVGQTKRDDAASHSLSGSLTRRRRVF